MTKEKAESKGDKVNTGDKVWVTISRSVQLQPYETYRLEAGFSRTIKEGEDPMDLIADMEEQVAGFVIESIDVVREELGTKPIRRK